MRVELIAHTPDPDKICATAARLCYSPRGASDLIDYGINANGLKHVIASGHESVIEHATFTFSVEGVSRALSHQLVRHRVASYSQQSQRYVTMKNPSYVIPESIKGCGTGVIRTYVGIMDKLTTMYNSLIDLGIPPEDARYILPNACATNIVVTMNARELRHFFSLRCCNRAQWEIRELADKMLELCKDVAPIIFEDAGASCVRGCCPEGEKSCGNPRT